MLSVSVDIFISRSHFLEDGAEEKNVFCEMASKQLRSNQFVVSEQ